MQLQTINTNVQTMSSREIAEVTCKNHADVMRDVRAMVEKLTKAEMLSCAKSTTYTGKDGRSYPQYELDKDTCMTLLLGYDVVARMRVVKRWQELEVQNKELQTYGMVLPKTYGEAIIALGQNLVVIEQQTKLLEVAKPKVSHYDNYVESSSLKTVTNAAKEMKLTSNVLWDWLRKEGHAFKNEKKNIWTKGFIEKGYGEMKQFTRKDNGYSGTQPYLTSTGDLFIKQNFTK